MLLLLRRQMAVKNHHDGTDLLKMYEKPEMWANAQRDGRPAKYRWHPLFNAAKFADAHY